MNLIERLVAKGWGRYMDDGAMNGKITVMNRHDKWIAMVEDAEDVAHLVPSAPSEQALLRSRVGAVTVAQILGEPEPSVDDVIRERLREAGWGLHDGVLRIGHWAVVGTELKFRVNPNMWVAVTRDSDILALMRAPFGSVTVAAFCGIDVSDLEVLHD